MRVAITGVGGKLGAAVHEAASGAGHKVVGLSSTARPGTSFWALDVAWQDTSRLLSGVDVLVHCAAYIPADHSALDEAERCWRLNALGTLNLLLAAEAAGVRRFVFVSGANLLRPRGNLVTEDDPLGAEHAPHYLGSKAMAEIYVRAAARRGLDTLIVRPSSIYGPGMTRGVMETFARKLLARERITLTDGGRFTADYVWRADVAGVLCAAINSSVRGEVNLGSGVAYDLLSVARLLCELTGASELLLNVQPPLTTHHAFGFTAVDITRARTLFGFQPTELRAGLSAYLHTMNA